jgi:hypothetical protein
MVASGAAATALAGRLAADRGQRREEGRHSYGSVERRGNKESPMPFGLDPLIALGVLAATAVTDAVYGPDS